MVQRGLPYTIHNPIDWLFFNWETNVRRGTAIWKHPLVSCLTHPHWSFLTSPFGCKALSWRGTGVIGPGLPYIVTSCFPDGGTKKIALIALTQRVVSENVWWSQSWVSWGYRIHSLFSALWHLQEGNVDFSPPKHGPHGMITTKLPPPRVENSRRLVVSIYHLISNLISIIYVSLPCDLCIFFLGPKEVEMETADARARVGPKGRAWCWSVPKICLGFPSSYYWLVVLIMNFMTFHILGISSSQLTFIFFRGVENHQPVYQAVLWSTMHH